jgi:Zn-dependent oligopeptidase
MSIAYGSRCFQNNSNDNQEIVLNITKLRKEKANLLKFKSHADYILEDRMASTPTIVENFLDEI